MPVPALSLLGLKRIRGFVSILRYINPTIIIIIIINPIELKHKLNYSFIENGINSFHKHILESWINHSTPINDV